MRSLSSTLFFFLILLIDLASTASSSATDDAAAAAAAAIAAAAAAAVPNETVRADQALLSEQPDSQSQSQPQSDKTTAWPEPSAAASATPTNKWLAVFGERDGAVPLSCFCSGTDICCETTKGTLCDYGVCRDSRV